jgi:hypothetical protein
MVNRKCTRHDRSSIWKFRQSGEVNPPLTDLHHRLLSLILVSLVGALPLIEFPRPRAISNKMIRTSAIVATIVVALRWHLRNIWPLARLLCLLWWHRRSELPLLLRRPKNQSSRRGITLWCSGRRIGNNPIPRWLRTRGSSRVLPLLLGGMRHNAVFLSQGHVDQLTESVGLYKVQALLEFGTQAPTEAVLFLGIIICVIPGILAQMIEILCVLQNCVGTLCKSQELVKLSLQ